MPVKYVVNGKGYVVEEANINSFLAAAKKQGLPVQKVGDDHSKPVSSTDGSRLMVVDGKGYVIPEANVEKVKAIASARHYDVVDITETYKQEREKMITATLSAAEQAYSDSPESGAKSLDMLKKTIHQWNDNDIVDMYKLYNKNIEESENWGTTLAKMRTLAPGKEQMGGKGFNLNRIGHRLFLAFEEMAAAPTVLDSMYRNITGKPQTETGKFISNYLEERERLTSENAGFLEKAMGSLVESLPAMVLSYTSMGLGAPLKGLSLLSKPWTKAVLGNVGKAGIVHGLTTAPRALTSESLQYDLDKNKLTFADASNILMKVGTEVLTESIGDAIFGVTVGKIAEGTVARRVAKSVLNHPVKKMFADALKVAGANFVTEGFIEEGSNTILNAATDMITGRPDAWANFWDNYMEASLLGGVSTIPLSLLGIGGASISSPKINRINKAVTAYAEIAEETIPDLDPAKQAKVSISKTFRAGVNQAQQTQEAFDKGEITPEQYEIQMKQATDKVEQVIGELNTRRAANKAGLSDILSFDSEMQHMLMLASYTHDTLANMSPVVEKYIEEKSAAAKKARGDAMIAPDQMFTDAPTAESVTAEMDAEMQEPAPVVETPTAEPVMPETPETETAIPAPEIPQQTKDVEYEQIVANAYDEEAIEKIRSGQATPEEISREAIFVRKAINQLLALKQKNPSGKRMYNKAIKAFDSILSKLTAQYNAQTGQTVDFHEPLNRTKDKPKVKFVPAKKAEVKPEPVAEPTPKATVEKPKAVKPTKEERLKLRKEEIARESQRKINRKTKPTSVKEAFSNASFIGESMENSNEKTEKTFLTSVKRLIDVLPLSVGNMTIDPNGIMYFGEGSWRISYTDWGQNTGNAFPIDLKDIDGMTDDELKAKIKEAMDKNGIQENADKSTSPESNSAKTEEQKADIKPMERISTPKTRVPSEFRELNGEEQGGAFTSQLKKGDVFTIGNNEYTVTVDGKKFIRIKRNDGKTYTVNKFFTKDGEVGSYYGGDSKTDQVENLFRDIEGQIVLDLVNENNPFHEMSFVTKTAIAGYEAQAEENNAREKAEITKTEKPKEEPKEETPTPAQETPKVIESKGMTVGNINGEIVRVDPKDDLDALPGVIVGKETVVKVPNGERVKVRYMLIPLSDLVTSNNNEFVVNPDFPIELQNRKRDTTASREQVLDIEAHLDPNEVMDAYVAKDGAPVVVRDKRGRWLVMVGNGRVMGMRRRTEYRGAEAMQEYEQAVKDRFPDFGIDPNTDNTGMILVRAYYGNGDVTQLTQKFNKETGANMSPVEQAMSDATAIANQRGNGNDLIDLLKHPDLLHATNQTFLEEFLDKVIGTGTAGYVDKSGNWNTKMENRVEMALIAYVFNASPKIESLLEGFYESEESTVKSLFKGMIDTIHIIAKIRNATEKYGLLDLDITQTVLDAVSDIDRLRSEGVKIEEAIDTIDIFAADRQIIPEDKISLYYVLLDIKSQKAARDFLGAYYESAWDAINPEQSTILSGAADSKEQFFGDYIKEKYDELQKRNEERAKAKAERNNKKMGASSDNQPAKFRQATSNTGSTIGIGQIVDAIRTLLPKTTELGVQIDGDSAVLTISYRGKPRQIVINAITGRITDSKGNPIYSGRTSLNRDQASNIMAIIDIVKADNEGNMTAYHEGFHLAFALFLSEKEQRTLIEAYSGKKLADMTQDEIIAAEEKAARQFELLIQGKMLPAGVQRTTLQKLWDAIKEFARKLFGNDFAINHLDVLTRIKNADYKSSLLTRKPIFGDRYMASEAIAEAERQMEAVRKQYQGTDQWLKAPNGKDTKLNERQWLQVRTPNFLNWFGDWINDPKNASKVVDENGEPMVVYHWSAYEFNEFIVSGGSNTPGGIDVGVWFTKEKEKSQAIPSASNIRMEVFLNIRQPKSYDALDDFFTDVTDMAEQEAENNGDEMYYDSINSIPYTANMYEKGNDGIYIDYDFESKTETYIALEKTQIKSATANVGTFDPENADIRYQEAVEPRGYKPRITPAPKKTVTVYKAFRLINGKLYPMFVGAEDALPVGEWIDATEGGYRFTGKNGRQYVPALTGVSVNIPNAKVAQELFDMGLISSVKTKQIKCVAYRPGWHGGELPFFPQAGTKANNPDYAYPHYHNAETVIAEVEMDADRNYKAEYEETAERNKKGEIIKSLSGLRTIPEGGYYEYPTNPMFDDRPDLGKWYISGSVKINRVLSRAEANAILDEQNVPRQLWADEVQSVRYKEAPTPEMDSEAALSADATLQAIMDSGVQMSIRLKGFIHKMLIVLAKDQKASQKEQLNIMMKKFHEYVKATLPKMGFTKAMVLHITTRFGNIRTVKSFIKEAQKLDKMINEAYGKKMYSAIMDASRASISEKVNLYSTSQGKTDLVAMKKLQYINSVLHMSGEEQSAEFDRLESIEPGEDVSNEESEMIEFRKWAVQLFSGLKVPEVTKGGATRYSYADPAKLAMAYHEIGSLVANGKTLQSERMAKIKAEQEALRYKIKAMLLGGGSTLTDFERQDLEKKRKKKIPNVFEAFHAQLAYLETIFEEMDNLSLRNHKKLIEYKKTLEQSIKDYSANLDEESTDKDMIALLDMKEHLSHIIELISETAEYKGMYNGWFQDVFYGDLYNAKAKQEAGTINFAELFKAKRKEFAKKAGLDRFWFSYGSASLNQAHREIDMVDSDGSRQKRKFTMQQIMAIYAYTLDPKLQVTLQNTGFDDASLADLDRILTESQTGKYAKMFVDYIVNEFMPMYYETINDTYVERYGFDLPQEMNYFPVIRRFPKDVKMDEPGEPRRIISESMYVGNASLIQRVNSGLPLALDKLSFDAQLITHVHNMEHFKAFAMPMYRARMTILKRDVAQAFQDVLGRQRWDTLVGFYRDEAANGYTQINKTTTDRVFNTLMNNAAFAFLNLKPSVGIKQMSSTILMAAYMTPLEAAENYAWALAHPGKMFEILRKSPTFQIRYKQGITAEQHMALQHGDSSTITSLIKQYINDYINFGKYGDMVSVIVGGGAFYHQEYKRIKKANPKMSEDELEYQAVKQMEKMVERTQQSASILYSSRIRRDSMIGRMATQFQTQFHALYNAIYNKSNELRIPNADRGKTAWGLAMLVALYPMVAAFFDEGLVPPDDPKDVAMDVISQNLMLIPVFGNMIDTIMNAIVTGNTRQDYSRMFPSSSLLDSAMGSLNNAKQLKNDRSFRKHFEMMARIMLLVGAPVYPLHQTIYGISDYASGKDDRIGRVFGYSKGSLDMAEKENKANNK